jgi:two-component system, OmpR family, sensor kinase
LSPPASGPTEARALRRAALRLGWQTAVAVAVVAAVMILAALVVVLRSQHVAAVDLLEQTVTHADDVTDPPAGAWLVIQTPTKLISSAGLPAGFPDTAAIAAASTRPAGAAPETHTVEQGDKEYLVSTANHGTAVVQGVYDLSANAAERNRLIGALLVSGVMGLALAGLAGVFLASRAMKPLASALALQRRFVADASHELRTPLTLLSTRAQLVQRGLRRGRDPAALAADIDGLVTDADHLSMILEELLVAADPRGEVSPAELDLCLVGLQVADACEPAARAAGVLLTSSVRSEPVLVSASVVAVRRALTALVDNAIRHASTEVSVTVGVRGGRAVVEVSDDGPGIDAEMLPKLFERYESTADPGSEAGSRRYGLGLALVSEVAARYGGMVSASNRPRTGSTAGGGSSGTSGATLELSLPQAP